MKLQEILPYIQQGIPFIYDWNDGFLSDEELFEDGTWWYLDTMGYFEFSADCIRGDKWRIPKQVLPADVNA